MDFPYNVEDFKKMKEQGKTVAYAVTESENTMPDYDANWELHSSKRTPDRGFYNWASVMTFEDAADYEAYVIENDL